MGYMRHFVSGLWAPFGKCARHVSGMGSSALGVFPTQTGSAGQVRVFWFQSRFNKYRKDAAMNSTFVSTICPIDVSSMPFFPPRVTPPAKPLNLPQSFIQFLRNPLLIIPEPVYHERLVLLHGAAAIVWVTDPT